jgi:hypothetical protein
MVAVEQRAREYHNAVSTVAALRRLLFNNRSLQGIRGFTRPEAFERCDRQRDRSDRPFARWNGFTADENCARSALLESTAKLRSVKS